MILLMNLSLLELLFETTLHSMMTCHQLKKKRRRRRTFSVPLATAFAGDHLVSNQSMPREGSCVLAHIQTPCSWLQCRTCYTKPEKQGLLWSTLCLTYPRGSAAFAKKPCTTLRLVQPQNIRRCLVPTNFLPRWGNQSQQDCMGSLGLLTELCFFVHTFFVLWAFFKWRDNKINRKDRPSIPCCFTRPEKSHHQISMLF